MSKLTLDTAVRLVEVLARLGSVAEHSFCLASEEHFGRCTLAHEHTEESALEFLRDNYTSDLPRTFSTGATRSSDNDKLDYEGFFSPFVLRRRAEYMHENRRQGDGSLRESDNWQKGIPRTEYTKSLLRHVVSFWCAERYTDAQQFDDALEELLCAIMFNAEGYLHELLIGRNV